MQRTTLDAWKERIDDMVSKKIATELAQTQYKSVLKLKSLTSWQSSLEVARHRAAMIDRAELHYHRHLLVSLRP